MQTQISYIVPNTNKYVIQLETDPTIDRKWRMNFNQPIKIYRDIDNTVKFVFKNSDQKPVNLTGYTFLFYLISDYLGYPSYQQGNNPQFSFSLPGTIVSAVNGIVTVLIPASVLVNLNNNFYNYTMVITDNNGNEFMGYTTEDYQVRGQIELENGSFPGFICSAEAIFSAQTQGTSNPNSDDPNTAFIINALDPINAQSDGMAADIVSGCSSRNYHTAQFYFAPGVPTSSEPASFTGTITVQGSLDPVPNAAAATDWLDIVTFSYTNQANPDIQTWQGVYTFIRFAIVNNSGYTLYAYPVPYAYQVFTDGYIVYDSIVSQILYRS